MSPAPVKPKLPAYASTLIRIGIAFVEAFVAGNTHLSDQQKVDLEGFIEAGQKLLADFGVA